jgi:hypothetical protein
MSRTAKDERRRRTIRNVCEIVRRPDGSFDIFNNEELAQSSIPDKWLADQFARYGICGEEFKNARRELAESGKVKLVY